MRGAQSLKEVMRAKMKYLFIIWMGIPSSIWALFCSNPSEPNLIDDGFFIPQDFCLDVKVGYQKDIVYDRILKLNHGRSKHISQFDAHWDQGVITLNVEDQWEIYGLIGSMRACWQQRSTNNDQLLEYQSHHNLAWGIGSRLIFFKWDLATFGLNATYQCAYPHTFWNTLSGSNVSGKARMSYQEWQVNAAVSYEIDFFIPYICIKYSGVSASLNQNKGFTLEKKHLKLKNRRQIGMGIGATFSPGKYADLTIESQLFDEEALTLSANVRF